MRIMKRARASGQTSLDCWLKIKVAAENCKTSQFKISVSLRVHVYFYSTYRVVVWQKWAWSPEIFRRAPRAHSFKRTPLLKFLDPPLHGSHPNKVFKQSIPVGEGRGLRDIS